MLVGGLERCARCGTLLRGGRTACPSCGLDQTASNTAPEPELTELEISESKPTPIKKTICAACMTSVRDDSLVEYDGSRICPDCHERMKGKMDRKK